MEKAVWELLAKTAVSKGVDEEQLRRFVDARYIPYEWQLGFHAAAREADIEGGPVEIGAGGARGPGKSHAVFAQVMIDDCQRFPHLKGLFLRQTGKAAEESFQDLIGNVLRGTNIRFEAGRSVVSFPNGSRVVLGGFSDAADIDKYVGIEYDVMAVEELNQLTEDKIDKLKGSLRSSKGWRPRMYTSFNAGGVGHNFVKERFVIPHRENKEKNTRFFPATYKDNPRLNKEYIEYLEGLKGDLGRAWREGDFDLFEGQFFREWRYEKHAVNPFRIPDYWQRYRAYDYGYSNPACCKWYALDHDGRVYVYREKYWKKEHRMDVEHQAEIIRAMSIDPYTEQQEEYVYSVADPAIFSPTGMVDKFGGQTIAETFARYGIVWIAGTNRRVDGWSLMHQYLHHDDLHIPKLLYFNTCIDSIRTIPSLSHDERKPEDVDTDGEDHAADTDRYFLSSLHEQKSPQPLNEIERKLAELREAQTINPRRLNDLYYGR